MKKAIQFYICFHDCLTKFFQKILDGIVGCNLYTIGQMCKKMILSSK